MDQQWSVPVWAVLAVLVLLLVVGVIAVVGLVMARRALTRPVRPSDATEVEPVPAEYLITRLGDPGHHTGGLGDHDGDDEPSERALTPVLPAPVFADLVLREGAVQAGSLASGLRRALTAENRHRMRFAMRAEVKRARKQRRTDLRAAARRDLA